MARYLQEPSKNGSALRPIGEMDLAAFGEAFPALWEFMTLARWESGKSRVLGSLTLFVEQALVKACVFDKDSKLMAFIGASGLISVLEEVEQQLAASSLSWRPARERPGK